MADRPTNQTTAREPGGNSPGEISSFVRAVVLGGQDNRSGYPGAGYCANSGTHDLAISLLFVGRAAGDHAHGCRSHQVQT
jgi:hypothetical protein